MAHMAVVEVFARPVEILPQWKLTWGKSSLPHQIDKRGAEGRLVESGARCGDKKVRDFWPRTQLITPQLVSLQRTERACLQGGLTRITELTGANREYAF